MDTTLSLTLTTAPTVFGVQIKCCLLSGHCPDSAIRNPLEEAEDCALGGVGLVLALFTYPARL